MTTINELIDLKGRRALITGASGKFMSKYVTGQNFSVDGGWGAR